MAIHPSCMVLEFVLRHPGFSHLLNRIFLVLPLPPPPFPPPLPKLVLLRRIATSPVSDAALFALELIHQQNLASHAYSRAPTLLLLIQSAYLHAAVGSTLAPLRRGDLPEFLDAVERTWRMRVWDLEASEGSGLVSVGLLEWKGRMEAAAAAGARDELLGEWGEEEGRGAVMAYWTREMELMGPTAVEMAAEACLRGLGGGVPGGEEVDDGLAEEVMGELNLDGLGGGAAGEGGDGQGEGMEVEENLDGLDGGPGVDERGGGQGEGMEVEENLDGLGGGKKTTGAQLGQGGPGRNERGGGQGEGMEVGENSDWLGGGKKTTVAQLGQGGPGGNKRGGGQGERMEVEENSNGLGGGKKTTGAQVGQGGPGGDERDCRQGEGIDVEENLDGLGGGEKASGVQVGQGEVRDNDNGDHVLVRAREDSEGLLEGEMRAEGAAERVESGVISVRTNIARTPSVPTPEVKKVKEDLRRSLEDLQNVVEDPLPNAKEIASRIIASKSIDVMPLQEPVENHNQEPEGNQTIGDDTAPVHCVDKASEVIPTGSTGVDIELKKNPKKVSGHSPMDWNPTAQTSKCEDESIESSSDNTASPSRRLRLRSPRKTKISPLKPVEDKQGPKKRRKFSLEEEDALREAVKKYGQGNWKTILTNYRDVFQGRTEGNLKDKWRNMTK